MDTIFRNSIALLKRVFTRRHAPMLVVVALGAVLRITAMLAYKYAFFFPDSAQYTAAAVHGDTDPRRPIGYSLFLHPFIHNNLIRVVLLQHLVVLVFGVVCYVYLLRRNLRPWVAALTVAPLLLGPSELILEHFVLAETAYVVLTVIGLMLLTRSARTKESGRWHLLIPAAAGLALAYAALTRTVGLPICALGFVYLLIRIRAVRWQSLAVYTLALVFPLVAYLGLYHSQHGVYAFGQYQGRFMYARTMTFVDCKGMPAEDQKLCYPVDKSKRPGRIDHYIWLASSPANIYDKGVAHDATLEAFAVQAIKNQPGDYLATIARETSWVFIPPIRPDVPDTICHDKLWVPQPQVNEACGPSNYLQVPPGKWTPLPQPVKPANAESSALFAYGRSEIVYGPLLGLAMLGTLVLVIVRFRRGDRVLLGDGLLFGTAALGMLVVAIATSMYELRYSIPAIPVACIGLALAFRGARSSAVATPTPSSAPAPALIEESSRA